MPLITCPDCQNTISVMASQCVHCGRPITFEQKSATVISVHPESHSGLLKDDKSGEYIRFEANNVEDHRSLRGFSGSKVKYGMIGSESLRILPPKNAVSKENAVSKKECEPESLKAYTQDKLTTKNSFYLIILLIAANYWIAKGTPNPTLFFNGASAKEECTNFAEKNNSSLLLSNGNKVTANATWIKEGKRVVQLLQKVGDDGINEVICVVGNGIIYLPSRLDQPRWR